MCEHLYVRARHGVWVPKFAMGELDKRGMA